MDIVITINCDNAAFDEEPRFEVARILSKIVKKLEENGIDSVPENIMDINGNRVGKFTVEV